MVVLDEIDSAMEDLRAEVKALDYVCREWGKKLDERDQRIEELEAEADEEVEAAPEVVCKYKTCPEEQAELKEQMKRSKLLDYVAGLAQGLTTVGVVWLLYQQWVIFEAGEAIEAIEAIEALAQ